jgi:hypothetical protein
MEPIDPIVGNLMVGSQNYRTPPIIFTLVAFANFRTPRLFRSKASFFKFIGGVRFLTNATRTAHISGTPLEASEGTFCQHTPKHQVRVRN